MRKLLTVAEKIYDILVEKFVVGLEANNSAIIIKIDNDLDVAGATYVDQETKTITIKLKPPSNKQKGVRTIAHELTHAAQFAERGFRYPTLEERIIDEFEAYKVTYEIAKIYGDMNAAEKALDIGSRYIAGLIAKL